MNRLIFMIRAKDKLKQLLIRADGATNSKFSQNTPALTEKQDQAGVGFTNYKSFKVMALLGAGVAGLVSFTTIAVADEAEEGLHSPSYSWPHRGILSSYDHAS